MRIQLAILLFAIGCASRTNDPAPNRPTPETGGFQAPTPEVVQWIELGSPVAGGVLQQTLEVAPSVGPLSQLMVKGVAGESKIVQVLVQYVNKQEYTIRLDKVFAVGDGQVLELREARQIKRVTLFVDPDSNGSVVVYGG